MAEAQHAIVTRRFQGHHTSMWCTCGWSAPRPVKIVRRSEMVELWRQHLPTADAGEGS
jgi:hypothetical protein